MKKVWILLLLTKCLFSGDVFGFIGATTNGWLSIGGTSSEYITKVDTNFKEVKGSVYRVINGTSEQRVIVGIEYSKEYKWLPSIGVAGYVNDYIDILTVYNTKRVEVSLVWYF